MALMLEALMQSFEVAGASLFIAILRFSITKGGFGIAVSEL